MRTQLPPICTQVRVDQGGLIGNLRAHITDVARRAAVHLPPNFMLSFTRPDCESNIDVEDDGDFNFLKASIKRIGPEAIVLFADVKSGPVNVAASGDQAAAARAAVTSPLKPNPFGRESPSRTRDPLQDAARHMI